MIDSMIPASAIPLFDDLYPMIPIIKPTTETGKPKKGKSHATVPHIPNINDAVAGPFFPLSLKGRFPATPRRTGMLRRLY